MFHKFMQPKTETVYALLRIVVGLLFAFHGAQGLFGFFLPPEYQPHVGSQGWCGSLIELVTGALVALGLFADCAAFIASGTMAVAYVQFHWKLHFDAEFFPAVNHGEPALLFCLIFLYLSCRGSGKWSLDQLRTSAKPR